MLKRWIDSGTILRRYWEIAPRNFEESSEHQGITVYIYGSKTDVVKVGIAVDNGGILEEERFFCLPVYATVFQPELVAILKALELCVSRYISFSVLSDSKSSLMEWEDPHNDEPLVNEILELVQGLEIKWY